IILLAQFRLVFADTIGHSSGKRHATSEKGMVPMTISRFFLCSTLAVALVGAAVPALADDASDKVVATINVIPIKQAELTSAETDIGSQLHPVPEDAKHDYLVRFLADLKLGAKAAEDAKLQDTPDFASRLEYYRDKILLDDLMVKEGEKADTPDARKKLY